jgi:hypothetical protein
LSVVKECLKAKRPSILANVGYAVEMQFVEVTKEITARISMREIRSARSINSI